MLQGLSYHGRWRKNAPVCHWTKSKWLLANAVPTEVSFKVFTSTVGL